MLELSKLDISMGVIYKLKQEIVDFIIEQKKLDPSLSCRKLTSIIQEKFHIQVSKSSVNAVFKESHLSSPVGRTPKVLAPRNFFIPAEKKDALRAQVEALLPVIQPPVAPVPDAVVSTDQAPSSSAVPDAPLSVVSEPLPPSAAEMVPPEEAPIFTAAVSFPVPSEESAPSGDEARVSLLPDPLEVRQEAVSDEEIQAHFNVFKPKERLIWEEDGVFELEGAGAVFLLASLWEMDKDRTLVHLISRALESRGKTMDDGKIEAALALSRLEETTPSELVSVLTAGMAALTRTDAAELSEARRDVIRILAEDRALGQAYGSALATMSVDVAGFEFTTSGGRKIYTDPFFSSFSSEGPLTSALQPAPLWRDGQGFTSGMPLFHAIERLANEFINNIEPLVVSLPGARSVFEGGTLEMLTVLAGLSDDPVDAAVILSSRGDRLAEFVRLPNIRRGFVIAGAFTDADRSRIELDMIGGGEARLDRATGRTWTLHAGRAQLDNGRDVDAALCINEADGQKRMVLSNVGKAWVGLGLLLWEGATPVPLRNFWLLDAGFCYIAKNSEIFVKIKNNGHNDQRVLSAAGASINRKGIVTRDGQKLWVVCEG